MPFSTRMTLFFALRLSCGALALLYPSQLRWAFALGSLQFVLLPMSLFVAVTQIIALAPALFIAHLLLYRPLEALVQAVLPAQVAALASLSVDTRFVAAFFVIDQLACVFCLFRVPGHGRSEPMALKRVLHSVGFGFLNCKTYFLVLLLHMRAAGVAINGAAAPSARSLPRSHPLACAGGVWIIDAVLGLSPRLAKVRCAPLLASREPTVRVVPAHQLISAWGLHWAALFYHQHRLAHMPGVYEDAHKFHHFLHDASAFDAHIYGSGQLHTCARARALRSCFAATFRCSRGVLHPLDGDSLGRVAAVDAAVSRVRRSCGRAWRC
jgi:hypothetical protein